MSELKYGDKVWVSEFSHPTATQNKLVRKYVGLNPVTKGHVCCGVNGEVFNWSYAVKAKEPEIVPWTFDTSPKKLPFMLREKHNEVFVFAATSKSKTVILSQSLKKDYKTLLDYYEWSEDGENWLPCGTTSHGV